MSLGEFFTMGEETNQDEVVYRMGSQPDLGQGDIAYYLIGLGRRKRDMTIMREVLRVGADTGQDLLQHEGEEGGVVIRGQLELTVGDKVQVLGPGDGYYFDSKRPHRFKNIGAEDLLIVSANTPPDAQYPQR